MYMYNIVHYTILLARDCYAHKVSISIVLSMWAGFHTEGGGVGGCKGDILPSLDA